MVRYYRIPTSVGRWILGLIVFMCNATSRADGLAGDDRDAWYHLSQGTEFFPLDFLLALNDADDGEPFMKNLARFGFIPDGASAANPLGLPVGMTAATTRDLRFAGVVMVGINCAACHTAALEYGGRPVLRADGGTNMFDAERFRGSIMKSVQKTVDNPLELARFVSRLVRQSAHQRAKAAGANKAPLTTALLKKLGDRIETVFDAVDGVERLNAEKLQDLIRQELQQKPLDLTQGLVTRADDPLLKAAVARVATVAGGKLQPDGDPLVEVIASLRILRARLEAMKAGTHAVMTTPGFGRVDAFGSARNKLFPSDPIALDAPVRFPFIWTIKDRLKWFHWDGNTTSRLERNIGEAIGVGAVVDPTTFESTIRLDNLRRLEGLAMSLTPPTWPAEFGAIDTAKAKAGAGHYEQHCAKCHVGAEVDGRLIVPLEGVKTDGRRVRNVRQQVGGVGFYEAQSPLLKKVLVKLGGTPDGDKILWRPSKDLEPDLPVGYPNRPLVAVWASPPFLHNGSVPNLYQLLMPPEKRDKTFPLGHREYDPHHLGYSLKPARAPFLFDTRLPGNSNSGHVYGTNLTDDERWELLEYLKTQ